LPLAVTRSLGEFRTDLGHGAIGRSPNSRSQLLYRNGRPPGYRMATLEFQHGQELPPGIQSTSSTRSRAPSGPATFWETNGQLICRYTKTIE